MLQRRLTIILVAAVILVISAAALLLLTAPPPVPDAERIDSFTQAADALEAVGLSWKGQRDSIGINRHLQRLAEDRIEARTLITYAENLALLSQRLEMVPVDYWDAGVNVYNYTAQLADSENRPYLELIAQAFARFRVFKGSETDTALHTALDLLEMSAHYVAAGNLVNTLPEGLQTAEDRALFLWQRLVSGTTRQLPMLNIDLYTHQPWERHNVTTLWNFVAGSRSSNAVLWGVSGFAPEYVGDFARNTNQVEHMAISAVLQQAVNPLPVSLLPLLNLSEDIRWHQGLVTQAHAEADKALNNAVADHFLDVFEVSNPGLAREQLENAVSG